MEEITLSMIKTKPILSVTRTQETTEVYALEDIEATIAALESQQAALQARLDYQYTLRTQFPK